MAQDSKENPTTTAPHPATVIQLFVWWSLNWETGDFHDAFTGSGHSEGYHWRLFREECKGNAMDFWNKLDAANQRRLAEWLAETRFAGAVAELDALQRGDGLAWTMEFFRRDTENK